MAQEPKLTPINNNDGARPALPLPPNRLLHFNTSGCNGSTVLIACCFYRAYLWERVVSHRTMSVHVCVHCFFFFDKMQHAAQGAKTCLTCFQFSASQEAAHTQRRNKRKRRKKEKYYYIDIHLYFLPLQQNTSQITGYTKLSRQMLFVKFPKPQTKPGWLEWGHASPFGIKINT